MTRSGLGWRWQQCWRIGLIFVVGACAPPLAPTLRSTAHVVDGAEPLTRLVVYEDLEGPAVTHAASTEFARDVVQRLATCGVAARVVAKDRMDPTPTERRVEAALARLDAHAVLIVQATGGEVGERTSGLRVKLNLSEIGAALPTWEASASTFFSEDDAGAGAAVSTLIITRLRDDGVLTRCRPDEAYPGCREDRHHRQQRDGTPVPRCHVAAPEMTSR